MPSARVNLVVSGIMSSQNILGSVTYLDQMCSKTTLMSGSKQSFLSREKKIFFKKKNYIIDDDDAIDRLLLNELLLLLSLFVVGGGGGTV